MLLMDRLSSLMSDHKTATGLIIVGGTCLGIKILTHCQRKSRLWLAVRAREGEREINFLRINEYYDQLPKEKAYEITSWSFEILKENLQFGHISCVEALRAYQRKAMESTLKTNCVCLFIEEAILMAEELDQKAQDLSYKKPPLFGVPISVKECVAIKGVDCTLGYVQDLFKPAKDHSAMVKSLLHLGAIPFVHTNNPLSLLTWGCSNAIYGSTTHPKNENRIPGGSSGGEAALISSGGSILGIGSDIGGSIRIPSTFCGLVGFKPSVQRLSHIHSPGGVPGRCKIIANEGPMSRDLGACVELLRLIWSDDFLFDLDPYVPPVPWNEGLFSSQKPLTIGFYTFDGYIQPAPAYIRAVEEAITILQSNGHHLVEFSVPQPDSTFRLLVGSISADGGYFLTRKMDKDIVPSEVNYGFLGKKTSSGFQRLLKPFIPWKRLRNLLGVMPNNMKEMRQLNADIDAYRRNFLENMQAQRIDALICPAMIMYPPAAHVPVSIPPATAYTSLFNVLDYPAGVIPITQVTKNDEKKLAEYPTNDPYDRLIKEACQGMEGFPIGVQVASLPYREEIALRVMKELQDCKK